MVNYCCGRWKEQVGGRNMWEDCTQNSENEEETKDRQDGGESILSSEPDPTLGNDRDGWHPLEKLYPMMEEYII